MVSDIIIKMNSNYPQSKLTDRREEVWQLKLPEGKMRRHERYFVRMCLGVSDLPPAVLSAPWSGCRLWFPLLDKQHAAPPYSERRAELPLGHPDSVQCWDTDRDYNMSKGLTSVSAPDCDVCILLTNHWSLWPWATPEPQLEGSDSPAVRLSHLLC